FGVLLYWGLFAFVVRAHEETRIKNSLLIGFGLALATHALAVRLWTADERSITTTYAGAVLSLGPIAIPLVRLARLVLAFAMLGTFVGGLVLGLAEAASAFAFGGPYREVVGLVIFLAVLVARPRGLFAR